MFSHYSIRHFGSKGFKCLFYCWGTLSKIKSQASTMDFGLFKDVSVILWWCVNHVRNFLKLEALNVTMSDLLGSLTGLVI